MGMSNNLVVVMILQIENHCGMLWTPLQQCTVTFQKLMLPVKLLRSGTIPTLRDTWLINFSLILMAIWL